jgi:arylsulfatase A-like enzyme/Flp pilus assembly protein TadD
MIRFFPAFTILLTLLFVSCGKQEIPVVRQKSNVILVSIDTLRADYLKLYQSTGVETPNLDQLAKEAVVFQNVVSQIPYTLPSHCTMLTGLYPVAHGVKDNVHDVLPENIETIAEVFQKQNFKTAGFIGSMVLSRVTGLGKGFQYYDDMMSRADIHDEDLGGIERRAEEVLWSFQNWFEKHGKDDRFFAFIHFYDPHSPYQPPVSFKPKSDDMKELYKGEIRYVDFALGELFAFLRKRGLWENTNLLITSDHGEMLQEHGEIGHGFFLYQPSLKVPIILKIPGMHGNKTISDLVELVDIPSTLLDLVNIPAPKGMQGQSLLPLIKENGKWKNHAGFSESYFAALQLGVSPLISVQDRKYKFIDAPKPELFDLTADPAESTNLASDKTSIVEQMRRALQQHQAKFSNTNVKKEKREVTPEEEERFASLGYLSGHVGEGSLDLQKDPKDYIDEWNEMLEATYLMQHGEYEKAFPILTNIRKSGKPTDPVLNLELKYYMALGDFKKAEEIVKEIGDTSQALTFHAAIYERTGQVEKASEAYRQALDKRFSYFSLYNYVLFLKRSGRNQEAMQLVQKVQKVRGDAEQSRPILGEIYFLLQQWDEAEKIFLELKDERPWEWKWYVQLASIYQIRGRPQEALDLLDSNYDKFSQYPEYLLRLGILCNATKQYTREAETFKTMIQVAPEDSRGYFYLAKTILDSNQNMEAVIQLCLKGFQLNPTPDMQVFGHYILGNAYHLTGRQSESEQQFKLAEKLEAKLQM